MKASSEFSERLRSIQTECGFSSQTFTTLQTYLNTNHMFIEKYECSIQTESKENIFIFTTIKKDNFLSYSTHIGYFDNKNYIKTISYPKYMYTYKPLSDMYEEVSENSILPNLYSFEKEKAKEKEEETQSQITYKLEIEELKHKGFYPMNQYPLFKTETLQNKNVIRHIYVQTSYQTLEEAK